MNVEPSSSVGPKPQPRAGADSWEASLRRDAIGDAHGRREALWLALAAAEASWVAPLFMALTWAAKPHPLVYLWLGTLVLMLGYFYLYRALVAANLSLRLQQGLLLATLVISVALVLRFHILTGAGLRGSDWFLVPFRQLSHVEATLPSSWLTVMFLIYLWARAIHLADRSLSAESVGFSFRSGVLVLVASALFVKVLTELDMSGLVVAYFFFALVAVALARVEQVSLLPNSSRVPFSGFWIGSTVGAVALLAVLGILVAIFFYAGGLHQLLRWLWPILLILQIVVAGLGALLLMVLDWILAQFSLDLTDVGRGFREMLEQLGQFDVPSPPPLEPGDTQRQLLILGILQAVITIAIPVAIVSLVLFFTWRRLQKGKSEGQGEEARESLLSARAVARNLQVMLQGGLGRMGELAGLVSRFGPGSRFLAAISIRRIYTNLVRLATEAGYPRAQAQTPYEYLPVLCKALPGSTEDVRVITEAYVNARYGLVPDTPEELQRIRDCWQRVRQQEVQGLKPKPS